MNIPPLLIMGGTLIMAFAYQLALHYQHCRDVCQQKSGSNRTVTRIVMLLHLVMKAVVLMITLVIVTPSDGLSSTYSINSLEP